MKRDGTTTYKHTTHTRKSPRAARCRTRVTDYRRLSCLYSSYLSVPLYFFSLYLARTYLACLLRFARHATGKHTFLFLVTSPHSATTTSYSIANSTSSSTGHSSVTDIVAKYVNYLSTINRLANGTRKIITYACRSLVRTQNVALMAFPNRRSRPSWQVCPN